MAKRRSTCVNRPERTDGEKPSAGVCSVSNEQGRIRSSPTRRR